MLDTTGGQATLYINLNQSDPIIDYSNSYYQAVNSSFQKIGMLINLDSNKTIINQNGIYALTIFDLVSNSATYYVQVGGAKNLIPSSFNENDTFTPSPGAFVAKNVNISGKTYDYVSNKNITFTSNELTIDHITVNGTRPSNPKQALLTGDNDSFEIKTYIKDRTINKTYLVYIKEKLDLTNAFSADTGNKVNQYAGYLNGDKAEQVNVLSVLNDKEGQADLNVHVNQNQPLDLSGKKVFDKINKTLNNPALYPHYDYPDLGIIQDSTTLLTRTDVLTQVKDMSRRINSSNVDQFIAEYKSYGQIGQRFSKAIQYQFDGKDDRYGHTGKYQQPDWNGY